MKLIKPRKYTSAELGSMIAALDDYADTPCIVNERATLQGIKDRIDADAAACKASGW